MIEHLVFLSIPGLRPADIHDPKLTPTLHRIAGQGASRVLVPTFPCVTSPVQASMLTGAPPGKHGVIANGFYRPDQQAIAFWVGGHQVLERPSIFTRLARERPGITSAAWHLQNIRGADADYIVTPAPIHEPDGTTRPWCYSKPDGLYRELVAALGHFPLQHYWGPLANIQSTKWIVDGALWLARKHAPNLQCVYLPHLDYAAQKHGPDSHEAAEALAELDNVLGDFMTRYRRLRIARRTAWLLAGEYALTTVDGAVHPNRVLRQAGLLKVREQGGHEYLDLAASDALAMSDHQLAHVYVNRGDADAVADLFRREESIADILVGRERSVMGMDHPRCGQIILIARPDRWFSYYYWLDDLAAPPFARTVDIHAKCGYDPLELFIDPYSRQIPLDTSLVKGSHGAPVTSTRQETLLLTTHPELFEALPTPTRDTDVFGLLCRAFNLAPA